MSRQTILILIGVLTILFGTLFWINNAIGKAARAEHASYNVETEQFISFIENDTGVVLKGETHVLNAWATWCGPCIKEIPELNKLQEKYSDRHFNFIALTDQGYKTVTRFSNKRNGIENDESLLEDEDDALSEYENSSGSGGAIIIESTDDKEEKEREPFVFNYDHMYEQDDFIKYLRSINPAADIRMPIAYSGNNEKFMPDGIPLNVIIHDGEILFYEIGYDEENIRKMDEILAGL